MVDHVAHLVVRAVDESSSDLAQRAAGAVMGAGIEFMVHS